MAVQQPTGRDYVDIQDHALIGNLHTAALVSIDGSIESYCVPNFDSPSVFARILDKNRGGHFSISPLIPFRPKQTYLPSSNVLSTKFLSEEGVVSVTDFLPRQVDPSKGPDASGHPLLNWLVRRVEVIRGTVPIRVEIAPAFDYGRAAHKMEFVHDDSTSPLEKPQKKVVFTSKDLTLDLRYVCDTSSERQATDAQGNLLPYPSLEFKELDLRSQGHQGLSAYAEFSLSEGHAITFVLRDPPVPDGTSATAVGYGHASGTPPVSQTSLPGEQKLDGAKVEAVLRGASAMRARNDPLLTSRLANKLLYDTNKYWINWIGKSTYNGRWREAVHRSALALKLLIFEPTGAIVASPTFSLPEYIGGTRNWDYRYTIHGTTELEELELPHLDGHKGSKPVRIGNGAADHLQLDIYGELMDCIYLSQKFGRPVGYDTWLNIRELVEYVIKNISRPDLSIWEVRSKERNFVYSKIMMWVAIDRGLRLADKRSLPCPRRNEWLAARDTLYEEIMDKGYNKEKGFFSQSYEDKDILDSAILVMPLVFFTSAIEPRFLSTLKQILKSPEKGGLTANNLVFRYDTKLAEDGVGGEEGAFSLTTLWAVEALGRAGQYDKALLHQAVTVFEDFLGFGNHCGLFSEEISAAGEGLGNAVQGFTHVTLISAAFNLSRTLAGRGPGH
ncbi:hypothetical protein FRC02_006645 [Tulasnella sp. 418]|nr:hypothetical protein FRC02_006645 [Tulasnella sp. 418]